MALIIVECALPVGHMEYPVENRGIIRLTKSQIAKAKPVSYFKGIMSSADCTITSPKRLGLPKTFDIENRYRCGSCTWPVVVVVSHKGELLIVKQEHIEADLIRSYGTNWDTI